MAKRNGKKLATLKDGHPRRLSDGRNAWRKMSNEQRDTFILWILDEDGTDQIVSQSATVARKGGQR